MLFKEKIEHMIEDLNESDLRQVVEYMAFLQFRSRFRSNPIKNESEMARLYAEFAETDRLEANEGMEAYNLPSCVKIDKGEGGLGRDSVILCH